MNGFYFDFVAASRAPSAPQTHPLNTVARNAGLLYERKITTLVEGNSEACVAQLPICSLRSHQQVARPDILIFNSTGVLCVEVKRTFNNDCFPQIERYRSLLTEMDLGAVRMLAVCEAFHSRKTLRYSCGVEALIGALKINQGYEVCIVSARELKGVISGNLGGNAKVGSTSRSVRGDPSFCGWVLNS
jgi:hypothetical protein